ncbi:hypothetical protein RQP46_011479 [Phenoliferia psychrophenolica]
MPALPSPTPRPDLLQRDPDTIGPVQASLSSAKEMEAAVNEGQSLQACIMEGDCEGGSGPASSDVGRNVLIAVGSVAGFAVLLGLFLFWWKRIRNQKGYKKTQRKSAAFDTAMQENEFTIHLNGASKTSGRAGEAGKYDEDNDQEVGLFAGQGEPSCPARRVGL